MAAEVSLMQKSWPKEKFRTVCRTFMPDLKGTRIKNGAITMVTYYSEVSCSDARALDFISIPTHSELAKLQYYSI
jgi:hypothetical protein